MPDLIVATDLSARSDRAVERAIALAGQLAATLTILHVVDDALPEAIAERRIAEARAAIDALLALRSLPGLPAIDVQVVAGRAVAEVAARAEAIDAGLIVLGAHHTQPLADLFKGTTAERTIRAVNRPTLVVKTLANHPYRRIVVGVDFSVYSRRAIDFVVRTLPEAELTLVHAYHVPFAGFLTGSDAHAATTRLHTTRLKALVDEEMDALFAGRPVREKPVHRVLREGETGEAILAEVERRNADLLITGTHGRTGVAHALLGSVAEHMLTSAPCDVLTVRAW